MQQTQPHKPHCAVRNSPVQQDPSVPCRAGIEHRKHQATLKNRPEDTAASSGCSHRAGRHQLLILHSSTQHPKETRRALLKLWQDLRAFQKAECVCKELHAEKKNKINKKNNNNRAYFYRYITKKWCQVKTGKVGKTREAFPRVGREKVSVPAQKIPARSNTSSL